MNTSFVAAANDFLLSLLFSYNVTEGSNLTYLMFLLNTPPQHTHTHFYSKKVGVNETVNEIRASEMSVWLSSLFQKYYIDTIRICLPIQTASSGIYILSIKYWGEKINHVFLTENMSLKSLAFIILDCD